MKIFFCSLILVFSMQILGFATTSNNSQSHVKSEESMQPQEPEKSVELIVYTAIEPYMLKAYSDAFEEKYPHIRLVWVRDDSASLTKKLIGERSDPQADVIFGLARTFVMVLDTYDMLEPYIAETTFTVPIPLQDAIEEPVWTPLNAWGGALCVDTKKLKAENLPVPASWADLIKPEYKGYIAMASPITSATGYMHVVGWLQSQGDEAGWEFIKNVDANIATYTQRGCEPCEMVAKEAIAIGISSDMCLRKELKRHTAIDIVHPQEGIGWEAEVAALLKGSKNSEHAKLLIDFATSKEVARIALMYNFVPARIDMQTKESAATMAEFFVLDPAFPVTERKKIVQKWGEALNWK